MKLGFLLWMASKPVWSGRFQLSLSSVLLSDRGDVHVDGFDFDRDLIRSVAVSMRRRLTPEVRRSDFS